MRRLVLLALFVLGCSRAITQPTLDLRFDLSTIDGQALPRTPIGWPADQAVQAASLHFPSIPALADGAQGLVTYTSRIAGQDYAEPLRYQVAGGILHINLCPINATCTLILTELVGPVAANGGPLLLTYSVGGVASSVFRFDPLGLD
jgi:hypothetical protein